MDYHLYTDGACSGNPGAGGYGWVLVVNDHVQKFKYDCVQNVATNNQMEILAAYAGLHAIWDQIPLHIDQDNITVYTDSNLVVSTMNGKFKQNSNQVFWNILNKIVAKITNFKIPVKFVWVKGHDGQVYNELADQLAQQGVLKAKEWAKKNPLWHGWIGDVNVNKPPQTFKFINDLWVLQK